MTKTLCLLPLIALAFGTSGCGQGTVEARLDPVDSADTKVTLSPKAVADRVQILRDLIDAEIPAKIGDRKMKVGFFKQIAPAVVEAMLEVEAERTIVDEYEVAAKSGKVPTKLASDFADVSDRYKATSVDDLRARVDIPPLDMLFTQASIESGWGQSPVSHDCHNIFGVHAATAAQKCAGHPILAYYPDFTGSIKRYVLLLNTGGAFKKFRQLRSTARNSVGMRGVLDSQAIVEGLLPYSERGQAYVNDVASQIQSSDMDHIYRDFMGKIF
jgi:uncharacterized FlgJ-related protein